MWTLTLKNFLICHLIFFIRVQLLYNAVLASSVQQSESALCVHIPPPFWASLPPLYHTLKKLTTAVLKMVSYSIRQSFLYMCNSWRLLFSLFFIFWLSLFSGWTELPLTEVLNSLLRRCKRDTKISFWNGEGFGEAVFSLKQDSQG